MGSQTSSLRNSLTILGMICFSCGEFDEEVRTLNMKLETRES